jgi:tetratricopeptide (TPR) repeat protein
MDIAFGPDGSQIAACAYDAAAARAWLIVWDLAILRRRLEAMSVPWPAGLAEVGNPTTERQSWKLTVERSPIVNRIEAESLVRFSYDLLDDDVELALGDLRRAHELDPDNATACNNLAWMLSIGPEALRSPAEALRLARRAVELAPSEPIYQNTLATALYRAGHFAEAIEIYQRNLTTNQRDAECYDLFFLSMCHARQQRWAEAADNLSRAKNSWQTHRAAQPAAWQAELALISQEADSLMLGQPGE